MRSKCRRPRDPASNPGENTPQRTHCEHRSLQFCASQRPQPRPPPLVIPGPQPASVPSPSYRATQYLVAVGLETLRRPVVAGQQQGISASGYDPASGELVFEAVGDDVARRDPLRRDGFDHQLVAFDQERLHAGAVEVERCGNRRAGDPQPVGDGFRARGIHQPIDARLLPAQDKLLQLAVPGQIRGLPGASVISSGAVFRLDGAILGRGGLHDQIFLKEQP